MTRDDVEVFDVFTQDLCHAIGDIHVRSTVRTIATNVIFFVEFIRNGVEVGIFGNRLMERRIEDGNARCIWEQFFSDIEPDDVRRNV